MTDILDRAQEREEEVRQDALAAHSRRQRPEGAESPLFCAECGEPIPDKRRKYLPGVSTCVECQQDLEREAWRVA